MKNNLKRLLITSGLVVSLAACSSSTGSSSSNNNSGGNQGDASQLTFVAPNIVPSLASGAANGYVVVNNPSSSIVTGVKYTLGNIIGDAAKITLDPISSANCAKVAANGSCTIKLTVPANTLAGSFAISASNKPMFDQLTGKVNNNKNSLAANLPTNPTIGVGQVLYTTTSGANGVTLYYYNTIVAGVPTILVNGVISSNQVGNLNNVILVDANNNPLPNQQVISGNLGAGAINLGLGSTFSILLPAPSAGGATQTIKVKTEQVTADGTVSNAQISTNSNTLTTTTGVGIANMLPPAIYLTSANPEQQITFSNTGDAAAQLQSLVASNPNIEVVFNPTSLNPNGVSSATLRLKNGATTATSSSITLNYNNGVSDKSQSASVDQNVVPGPTPGPSPTPTPNPKPVIIAGLTATLANNNFNVTTVNHTTIESMTITNTGNTTENNFVATLPSNFSLLDNAGSTGNCKVVSGAIDSTQSLAPNTNCSVSVKYDSTTVGSGTSTISIAYNYNGTTPAPTPATAAVNWQVTQSTANLVVTGSVPQPYIFPTTLVDGTSESSTYLFTIQNTGDDGASSISSVVNSTTKAGLFTANNTGATPVACSTTLAAGSSCQLGVQFGPIPDNESAGTRNGNLFITYKQYSSATTTESVTQNVQGQVATSGSAIFNAPSSGTATGFSNNAWASLTIGQDVTSGVVTYTLTNTGADAASNFIVTLPPPPTGWSQISTDCPTTTGTNLAISATCNVTLNPNTSGGNISATNFTLGLAWSDQDSPNGESQNLQTTTPAVTVIPKAAQITAESSSATGFSNNNWNNLTINQYATSGLIAYTITNGGNAPATNFVVTLPPAPTGWESMNTTCPTTTGTNLAVNATCSVTMKPNTSESGIIAASSLTLGLAWSDPANPSGTTQNMAIDTPGVTVNLAPFIFSQAHGIAINSAGTYAFIANLGNNSVTSCEVSESNLVNCANSGATGLNSPISIILTANNNYALITNNGSNKIIKCSVNGGTLNNCADSGATSISTPFGIVLNSAGTYAFITNSYSNNTVTSCNVNESNLSSCVNSGASGLSTPYGITLNSAGTYAFIVNYGGSVTTCSVSSGTLGSCMDSGATGLSNNTFGITLNPAGTYAFIVNSQAIVSCGVSGSSLSGCSNSGATGLNGAARNITLNPAGTYAFIANSGSSNGITKCSVSNGVLSDCAQTGFQP